MEADEWGAAGPCTERKDYCLATTVAQLPDACAGACPVVQEVEHWEGQSALIYHIDLLSSLSLETLTLLHSLHVWCAPGQGRWYNSMRDWLPRLSMQCRA